MAARPFLKWAGGKSQLLPDLKKRLPAQFRRYHEPFVGGGAFFFHLWNSHLLRHGAVLSDFNSELIDCYEVVRDHVAELIARLEEHKQYCRDKDYFYEVRSWDRRPDFAARTKIDRAARTIFLNRTCYNGLYRLNNKRQFNAPYGHYKNPLIVDPDNLHEVSAALQHVELRVGDFADVLERVTAGDFIYLDPPYVPVSATASFTHYTHQGFSEEHQRRLAGVIAELVEHDCFVMLSNSDTEITRAIYSHAVAELRTETVHASRKINCDGKKRGFVEELLVYNYEVSEFPTPQVRRILAVAD